MLLLALLLLLLLLLPLAYDGHCLCEHQFGRLLLLLLLL
jgi:hypothetical protein